MISQQVLCAVRPVGAGASINALVEGQAFGLNMAAGVNETGLCENALWWDGQIQHLKPCLF